MSKGDLTKFDAHIAALAMPDKSAITQAGDSMMKANDYIWGEKLKTLKTKNMELENKKGEQEYNFNEAKNPLLIDAAKLANQKSAMDIDEAAKENEFKAQKRPFELATTAAQASSASSKADIDAFDAAHKQSVFDMDMSAKRANINAINASTYAQNFMNRVNDDQYKTQDRANDMFWASEDLDTLEKERKSRVDAVQNDPNLTAKQKYEEIRLINNAAMKTKDTYYKDLQSASNIDWTKARAAKASGAVGGSDADIGMKLQDMAKIAKKSEMASPIARMLATSIRDYDGRYTGNWQGNIGNVASQDGLGSFLFGDLIGEGESRYRANEAGLLAIDKELTNMGSALTKDEKGIVQDMMGRMSSKDKGFKTARVEFIKFIKDHLAGTLAAYQNKSRPLDANFEKVAGSYFELENMLNNLDTHGWDRYQKILQQQEKDRLSTLKREQGQRSGYDARGRKSVGNDANTTIPIDANTSRKGSVNAAMAFFTD